MGLQKFKQYNEKDKKFYAAEIMSTPYLKEDYTLTGPGTFHMILTHIAQEDEEYVEHYKKEQGLKLLDNSLFELGYALPPQDVIGVAEKVDADILVSPDVIRDGVMTKINADSFIRTLDEMGKLGDYAIMGVPQGSTKEEWIDCYKYLVTLPEIQSIGLSIIGMITAMQDETGTDDIITNRVAMMDFLNNTDVFDETKWHHLLGLGRGPYELEYYKGMEFVRSNDSSNAWWHGYNGIAYPWTGRLEQKLKKEVDFAAPVNKEVEVPIKINLLDQRSIVGKINSWRNA